MFVIGDAVFTQARLARTFERARTASDQRTPLVPAGKPVISKVGRAPFAPRDVSTLGRLEIARIGIDTMILNGTDSRTLRVGLGLIPGTARPGEPGNVAIAGHRDTFFRPLRGIRKGDEIVLETSVRDYRYYVSSIEIVDPTDVKVLRSHQQNELTLVTCYPFSYIGRAPKRFIVHAVLAE